MKSIPHFIIAGAPKAGTTALWNFLAAHPDVAMARIKEPRFFSRVEGSLELGVTGSGPTRSGTFHRGMDWYRSLFDLEPGDGRRTGEASTHYFAAADSAELIDRHAPQARLIFLLRHPVDRLYSHYWEEAKLGWDLPDFDTMFATDHPRFRYYCATSAYERNLQRYMDRFDDDRMLILLHEDLKEKPVAMFEEVCRFLELTPLPPPQPGKRYNVQRTPRFPTLERVFSAAMASQLGGRLPEVVRAPLGKVRRMLSRLNSVPFDYPELSEPTRASLVEKFAGDVAFVEALLDRELPAWRA